MTTFVTSFFLWIGLLLLVSVPVIYFARRQGRTSTIRNFLVAAVAVALAVALTRVVGDLSLEQCYEAGNRQCIDPGSVGLGVLFVGGYIVVALGRAWSLRR